MYYFIGFSNGYISQLHDLGCKVLFFIEYVPVDGDTENLAPFMKRGNSYWTGLTACIRNILT